MPDCSVPPVWFDRLAAPSASVPLVPMVPVFSALPPMVRARLSLPTIRPWFCRLAAASVAVRALMMPDAALVAAAVPDRPSAPAALIVPVLASDPDATSARSCADCSVPLLVRLAVATVASPVAAVDAISSPVFSRASARSVAPFADCRVPALARRERLASIRRR